MGVYIYAKTLETNCPVTIDFLNRGTTNASCCEYDPEDCETLYQGSVYREYYQRCNGQPSCTIQVSWIPTPCDQDVYLERTNYMKMDFYCISDQALDTCENLVATDSPTFLWNSGYPSSPMSGSTCSCSVEVDCETTITITAIDLRLESSGGECKQAIVIEDGGSTVSFDCSSNNDYLPTVLYTSTSHFIEISINNELGTTGGYYFISVQGTNPSGSIRLACGTTSQASPNTESSLLPVCPSSVSTTTASTTSETTPSSYRSSTMTISPSTVQTTLVDSSTVSENTIVSSTYNTVIQNTDSVATTDDAVTQDTTIQNTNSATDPVTTASSMMTEMLTKYDTNMLTSSTTTGGDMSATALISTTVTSATGSTISSTMSTDGTTALKSSYIANMSTINVSSLSGFNTMLITTDGSLLNQTWPLQTNTNNLSNIGNLIVAFSM
ncbi:hypothetical protein FSP39_007222 [Pinctada imbricata]|uniref:Uncharacterized protein n=1 Tax=Pinctada imbricata TaxID=66713 RepID=A0AA89C6T5_PINIB|nr:hypothetical protein FSP39_007222 [Pinctada imbricata]